MESRTPAPHRRPAPGHHHHHHHHASYATAALGWLVAAGLVVVGSPVVASAEPAPAPNPIPGSRQVEDARQRARGAASQLGQVQARLASADARKQRLENSAEAAVERYNTAVYRRTEAEDAFRQTTARAESARQLTERKRRTVGQLAAASYRLDTGLAEVSAYLEADGPQGLLDQVATVSMVSASTAGAYESLRASRSVAAVLDTQAEKAFTARRRSASEAAAARREVVSALAAQSASVEAMAAEKRRLVTRLATLERVSVRLATARQEGLERRRQARAEQARRRAERDRRERDRGGDGAGDSDRRRRAPGGGPTARQRDVAARFALAQLGEPYVFGAVGPHSWDCSGLTMRAWQRAGISMPHFARGQYWQSTPVDVADLRRGDLIFWASNPRDSNTIYHEAMYLGGGRMVHAPRPGRSVELRSMWYMGRPSHYARPR